MKDCKVVYPSKFEELCLVSLNSFHIYFQNQNKTIFFNYSAIYRGSKKKNTSDRIGLFYYGETQSAIGCGERPV